MRTDMELKLRGGSNGETLLGGTKIERFKWKDNISGNRADILLDETVRGWKEKYRWGGGADSPEDVSKGVKSWFSLLLLRKNAFTPWNGKGSFIAILASRDRIELSRIIISSRDLTQMRSMLPSFENFFILSFQLLLVLINLRGCKLYIYGSFSFPPTIIIVTK